MSGTEHRSVTLTSFLKPAVAALFAIVLISCSRSETPESETTTSTSQTRTFQVSRIDMGRSVGADRRIVTSSESFAPTDTVYASLVIPAPAPAAQVTARWSTMDGQLVTESTQMVPASDVEAVTEFHIVKPEGLAPGTYRLEILSDGAVVSTREFTVVAP